MSTVDAVQRVEAPSDQVWDVISSPGYLESCHPFCESNPVEHWPGGGSKDVIQYYGGRVVHRTFTEWTDGIGYDLVVSTPEGAEQALVRWRIEAGNEHSHLSIELEPRFLNGAARLLGPVVKIAMRRYLNSVVQGVAHFVETGEPVARNQFGAHPWFS